MAQSKGSRSLASGDCFGRGRFPERHPKAFRNSSGQSSTGSRTIRRPMRFTTTSVSPSGNLHSRGRRTAWLPPFWNSFARCLFTPEVYTRVDTMQPRDEPTPARIRWGQNTAVGARFSRPSGPLNSASLGEHTGTQQRRPARKGGSAVAIVLSGKLNRKSSRANPSPAQRTAVKLRPHQEATTVEVATSEPVVLHHGRQTRQSSKPGGSAGSFNSLVGGVATAPSDSAGCGRLSLLR